MKLELQRRSKEHWIFTRTDILKKISDFHNFIRRLKRFQYLSWRILKL